MNERHQFGWDLPPGVTSQMIDDQAYVPPECDQCGNALEECEPGTCPIHVEAQAARDRADREASERMERDLAPWNQGE